MSESKLFSLWYDNKVKDVIGDDGGKFFISLRELMSYTWDEAVSIGITKEELNV